jgi:hypothetical protein
MSKLALPLLTLVVIASPAAGNMQVQVFNSYYGSIAGEYDVDSVGTTPVPFVTNMTHGGHDFITFCLELHGPLSFGVTYDAVLNHEAVGHSGGAADPLDPRTAYLFSQFARGELSGYVPSGSGRADMADELQEVIWYIEGEWDTLDGRAVTWFAEASAAVNPGGAWYRQWGPNSIGNVRVMNLFSAGHAGDPEFNRQDQLVLVPAPGAAVLAMIGLGALGCLRRNWL